MFKNVASQKLAVLAWDAAAGEAKTGDAAQITAQISKDGAACAASDDTNPTELDATDAPGVYLFDMTQAETNADLIVFQAASSTSDIEFRPVVIYTQTVMRGTDSAALAATALTDATWTDAKAGYIDHAISTVDTVVDGIQTDLNNGTDGLGALKALIDTNKTELDGLQGADGKCVISTDAQDLSATLDVNTKTIEGSDATDQIRDSVVDDSTRIDGSAINALSGVSNISSLAIDASGHVESDVVEISGSATAANNAEIVFDTDFATNYNTTRDKWQVESNVLQVEGSDATDQIRDAVVDDATRIDASALNTLSGHDPGATIAKAGDLMGLANDAITSAKYDESTAFPIKSADTGDTQIARTGADGDTLETLSDEIAALNDISVANILAGVIEGTITIQHAISTILAFAAGVTDGAGTASIKYKNQAESKDRLTQTVNSNGERSATALDVTDL